MRLDRYLSNMGYGSRTEIKIALKRCQVKLNGKIVKKPDVHIRYEEDEVTYNDLPVVYEEFVYVMMNKPQGVISATEDSKDQTVVDLLEDRYKRRGVFPVGRLDKDTEGLLILTDDGKLAHGLLSPKKHVPKTYYVECMGPLSDGQIRRLQEGVQIEDAYVTKEAQVEMIENGELTHLKLTIYEGKFHQVKRMFLAVESEVIFLKRVKMGLLELDRSLDLGEYRPLSKSELFLLQEKTQIEDVEEGGIL